MSDEEILTKAAILAELKKALGDERYDDKKYIVKILASRIYEERMITAKLDKISWGGEDDGLSLKLELIKRAESLSRIIMGLFKEVGFNTARKSKIEEDLLGGGVDNID